jgi:hypothetical protein
VPKYSKQEVAAMTRCHGIFLGALFLMAMLSIAGCRDQEVSVLLPARARQGLKWGYIDEQGAFVIQPRFDEVRGFGRFGVARVGHKWGILDRSGQWALPARWDDVQHVSGNVYAVRNGDSSWELRAIPSGMIIAEGIAEWAYGSNKVIPVRREGEMWMAIDAESGAVVFQERFEEIDGYFQGLSAATLDGRLWGYIDEKGQWSCDPKWTEAESFYEDRAVVAVETDRGTRYGAINSAGEEVIPARYTRLWSLSCDRYLFSRPRETEITDSDSGPEVFGVLDSRTGKVVIEASDARYLPAGRNGRIPVMKPVYGEEGTNDPYVVGLVDQDGREVLPARYEYLFPLEERVVVVKKSGKMGLVNENGESVWPLIYDEIHPTPCDLVRVKIGLCEGYMRLSGEWVYWWLKE